MVVNLLFSALKGLREPPLRYGFAPEFELSVYICVRWFFEALSCYSAQLISYFFDWML